MNRRCMLSVAVLLAALTLPCLAQKGGLPDPNFSAPASGTPSSSLESPGQPSMVVTKASVLMLTVHDEKNKPINMQALVQITRKADNLMQAQLTQLQGTTTFVDLGAGVYDVAVSATGYLTIHSEFIASGRPTTSQMAVILKKDPSAIDLNAVKTKEMPSNIRKDLLLASNAIRAGKLAEAGKRLDSAYKKDPHNSDVNFLLGYTHFERNDPEGARTFLLEATKLAPHNAQALTLLGRVELQRNDYNAAFGPLLHAVDVDPNSWMPHYLLATVYLKQREYDKAKNQAQFAIERGSAQAFPAQLIKGEALANLKEYPQAIDALSEFLKAAPSDPSVPEVKQIIAEVEKRNGAVPVTSDQPMSEVVVDAPVIATTQSNIVLKPWGPEPIDATRPSVDAEVSCPAGKVIWEAGERVKDLVDDLSKFDATEDVYHEDVDQLGIPKRQVNLRFDYVASIAEPTPGRFLVDEYRSGRSGTEDFPDQIATRGLPTLAFVFHPDMRDDYEMTCEGLASWNSQATWLVHFQQREDKPHRLQDYVINGKVYPVSMRGRAWISADTYQIIRLEAELVNPMPEIQLLSEHQTVDYAPVSFPKSKTELWLPKNAELYFDFRKHRYYRRHSFDHFMLFSVDMQEKRKEPKEAQEKKPESRTPKSKHHKVHA